MVFLAKTPGQDYIDRIQFGSALCMNMNDIFNFFSFRSTPEVKPLNVSHADDEACKRDLLYDRWYQMSKTGEPVFPQKSLVFSKNLENK